MMSNIKEYKGVVVPMITPLTKNFDIDFKAVDTIINRFIKTGVYPFILGTTGEASLIPNDIKTSFVKYYTKQFKGKTTLYCGISTQNLQDTINMGKAYADLGIDVAVATPPNGYPLGAKEQMYYFEKLANALTVPLIMYNIPQTTHISIDLQVIEKLSHHPNVVGIKDSEDNAERQKWSLNQWKDRKDFVYFSGSSFTSVYSLSNGGSGIVPSGGNLVPNLYQQLYLYAKSGDIEKANLYQKYSDDVTYIYVKGRMLYGSLPALKVMMELAGICHANVIPPFQKLSDDEVIAIKKAMLADEYLQKEITIK